MIPNISVILDEYGVVWQVVKKLEGEKHPSFLLRPGKGELAKYMLVPNAIHNEPGIVDRGWNWVYSLNLTSTKITTTAGLRKESR